MRNKEILKKAQEEVTKKDQPKESVQPVKATQEVTKRERSAKREESPSKQRSQTQVQKEDPKKLQPSKATLPEPLKSSLKSKDAPTTKDTNKIVFISPKNEPPKPPPQQPQQKRGSVDVTKLPQIQSPPPKRSESVKPQTPTQLKLPPLRTRVNQDLTKILQKH